MTTFKKLPTIKPIMVEKTTKKIGSDFNKSDNGNKKSNIASLNSAHISLKVDVNYYHHGIVKLGMQYKHAGQLEINAIYTISILTEEAAIND